MMKSFFEQNGGTYHFEGDYRIPNLTLPDEPEHEIGVWGQRRLNYLKQHRKGLYAVLLTSGKLNEHLREIDVAAHERLEVIVRQMMEAQGVTEQLKAEKQMEWVGMVNCIRFQAEEIIRNELIYEV